MSQHNLKQKVGSIMVIVAIVYSGLFIIMPTNSIFSVAIDMPSSTEKIDNDFVNGTLDNVSIEGIGSDAFITLKPIELNLWLNKTPAINPHERHNHALATIWGTNIVLLFGGWDGGKSLDDTWRYDFIENRWINITQSTPPPKRNCHAMTSIYGTDKVLLMGGEYSDSTDLNDTWIYDLSENMWSEVTPIISPGRISQHKMAPVYGTDKVVLFIGARSSTRGINNETWIYDLSENSWTKKTPANSPEPRSFHSMASIYGTDKVIIFGGFVNRNDTWIYDLSENNWTRKAYGPEERYEHAMASIYGTDKVILFGGFRRSPWVYWNDTWLYDLSEDKWTRLNQTSFRTSMWGHSMATVWGTDKVVLFTGPEAPGPKWVNETWVFELWDYIEKGSFISTPFKFGPNSTLKNITWEANVTFNTSIKFRIRTAQTESELATNEFLGVDGSVDTFYNSSGTSIWEGHYGDNWVQYQAFLETTDNEITPVLRNVTITYNFWPNTTLVSPLNGFITENDDPLFIWNFTDRDSNNQTAFQIIVDDDNEFKSINYDSGKINSTDNSTLFSNVIDNDYLSDGTWYWKVRTKDNDGDWGLYRSPWIIIIDTKAPSSIILNPINDRFYNNLDFISGIAYEVTNGTGLDKVEITIKDLNEYLFWNGDGWSFEKNWLLTNDTKEWSYNSSSITWASGSEYHVRSRATDNATNIEIPSIGKIFTFDKDNVLFSNAKPLINEVSTTQEVEVGITISDTISGVNASTIQYAVSENSGTTWNPWLSVEGLNNQREINVALNLTFPNGSGNRIKWRAKDIVGNGPKESKSYVIKVNTWQPIPRVILWSPENGSIIQTKSVKLSWMLEDWKLTNVSYDIYFDTINPPAVNQTGIINTSLNINDLSNSETYFWKVIPRIGTINGSCLSGIWSFTVDIPKPSVNLISPPNGSIIQALRPTFVWSVNYTGSEELTYDIYLGKNKSLEIQIFSYDDTNYLSKNTLAFNETYYWKVVPKAGGLEGFESETWWFTVRPKDYVPTFGIQLILEPAIIEIRPGETKFINTKVTNLGEITDKIVLSLPEEIDPRLIVEINQPKIIEVDPNGTAVFNITIQAKENVKDGEISIIVVAASSNAAGYSQIVEKRATLTVKILSQTKHDTGSSSDASWYWIILLIIFVMVIVLIIGLILKRKQKPEQEPPPVEAITPEPEVEGPQTPEKVPEVVTTAPTTIPTVDTTEADSTPPTQATPTPTPMPGQTPQPQIAKTPEQPQLPPAHNVSEDQPEVTEQPLDQQISDSTEEKRDGENKLVF